MPLRTMRGTGPLSPRRVFTRIPAGSIGLFTTNFAPAASVSTTRKACSTETRNRSFIARSHFPALCRISLLTSVSGTETVLSLAGNSKAIP